MPRRSIVVALGIAAGLLAGVPIAPQASPQAPPLDAAEAPSRDDRLTVTGTVVLPGGAWDDSKGVTVSATGLYELRPQVARPDKAGRFEVRGRFGFGGLLHGRSADGTWQGTVRIPQDAARELLARPVELRLAPAVPSVVVVEAGGRPVAGATVSASRPNRLIGVVRARTDDRGRALIHWPAESPAFEVEAWHPTLGIGEAKAAADLAPGASLRLALRPPEPLSIRVVDPEGRGVAGLELAPAFSGEDFDWRGALAIAAARVRTDAAGMATVPWAPADTGGVELADLGDAWKLDWIDRPDAGRPATAHVHRRRAVAGRLVLPDGANAEGILITGIGYGPGNRGDRPTARARRDGSFTLLASADHGYALGVLDLRWASDLWTGLILADDAAEPAEIVIPVYPATPATVRVTRGPGREPVADADVVTDHVIEFTWATADGQHRQGRGGTRSYAETEADGVARLGLPLGDSMVRLYAPRWDEERAVTAAADQPVAVEFHRTWVGDRRVAGRLAGDPPGYAPSAAASVLAWDLNGRARYGPKRFRPEVRPGGTFEVVRDEEVMAVLVEDPAAGRAGFARIGKDDAAVEVAMRPTASYAGMIADADGRPLADRELGLVVETGPEAAPDEPIARARTDAAGRFRFDRVPAGLALNLHLRSSGRDPWPAVPESGVNLAPGEVRADARLVAQRPVDPGF